MNGNMKLSTILQLYDDANTYEKIKFMHKYEVMFDDGRNFNDNFLDLLEDKIKIGKSYLFTIEEIE